MLFFMTVNIVYRVGQAIVALIKEIIARIKAAISYCRFRNKLKSKLKFKVMLKRAQKAPAPVKEAEVEEEEEPKLVTIVEEYSQESN